MFREHRTLILSLLKSNKKIEINIDDLFNYQQFFKIITESTASNLTKEKGQTLQVFIPKIETPLLLRMDTSDILTFWQIFIRNDYNFPIKIEPKSFFFLISETTKVTRAFF